MTQFEPSSNDAPRNQSNGHFTNRHKQPESPLESAYLNQPLDQNIPTWTVPQTNEELVLFHQQCVDLLAHENAVNPQIKNPMDLTDYYESLKIQTHKHKLERAASLEYKLTQEGQEGLILGEGQPFDESKSNIDLIMVMGCAPGGDMAPPSHGSRSDG